MLRLQNVYIYNYADDNTGGVSGKSGEEVCLKLKKLTQDTLPCCTEYLMEANPSKFKLKLCFLVRPASYTSELVALESVTCVTILGVHVDSRLRFSEHNYCSVVQEGWETC